MKNSEMIKECELCSREPIEEVIFENYRFWITYCKSCKCPMIVCKEHRPNWKPWEVAWIMGYVACRWGDKRIRWCMNKMRDHAHVHIYERDIELAE